MILVIPKIELTCGRTNLHILDANNTNIFNFCEEPNKLLKILRKENAKTLYISDLDSLQNQLQNENLNRIISLKNLIDIPLELETNIEDPLIIRKLLDNGIYRLFLSDILFTQKEALIELIRDYRKSRISFAFNYEKYVMKTLSGKNHIELHNLLKTLKKLGTNRLVLNFREEYINNIFEILNEFNNIFVDYQIRLTISADLENFEKLIKLNNYKSKNIDSIIIGRPFYENKFPCQKIWRLIEYQLES